MNLALEELKTCIAEGNQEEFNKLPKIMRTMIKYELDTPRHDEDNESFRNNTQRLTQT